MRHAWKVDYADEGTSPSAWPTLTFWFAVMLNWKSCGASNTKTIVLPKQNPPISWPGRRGLPWRSCEAEA